MDSYFIWNQALLTRELETIHQLMRQLDSHLEESWPVQLKALVQNILTSLDRCRSMVKSTGQQHAGRQAIKPPVATAVASPHSISDSPWNQGHHQDCQDMSKRRKIQPTWIKQVQVSMQAKFEGPPDDGYSWRKYGQKDILGAKYPRGYYRCRHRHTHGCMATKHCQRLDENSSIFNITYQGMHTCVEMPQPIQMPTAISTEQDPSQENMNSLTHQSSSDSQLHINFRNSLTVETENLGSQDIGTGSFSFPSTSVNHEQAENCNFSHSSAQEGYHMKGTFSPFISSMTSESNLFTLPALQIGSSGGATQSDLLEIVSKATSMTSSPFRNFDFA